jgi:hypothetical protein
MNRDNRYELNSVSALCVVTGQILTRSTLHHHITEHGRHATKSTHLNVRSTDTTRNDRSSA